MLKVVLYLLPAERAGAGRVERLKAVIAGILGSAVGIFFSGFWTPVIAFECYCGDAADRMGMVGSTDRRSDF